MTVMVDFSNPGSLSAEKLPEIPSCRKTDILVRDGRHYAGFVLELSRQMTLPGREGQGGGDYPRGLELLQHLL